VKTLIWVMTSTFISAVLSTSTHAASYEILFEEGAFKYGPASSPDDVDNKYLARVTIRRDGSVLAKDMRGSTLPDAWAFYQRWNGELRHESPPSDTDVKAIFDDFEQRTATLRASDLKLGATKLADLADIVDVLNRVPALKSGKYPFAIGVHKGGLSVHGKPYVPRLLGGTLEMPYDPDDHATKATTVGGFIRSLNKNNAHGQQNVAAGINVHDGRRSRDYKDSEGCLTVRPQDWKTFYSALPSPEEWAKSQHVGVVRVSRGSQATPAAPTNLSVQ